MKRLLIMLTLMCTVAVIHAQKSLMWAIVSPQSGETKLLGNVSFLLAMDNKDAFTVVCKDGTVMTDVQTVNVVQTDPTGIETVHAAGGAPTLKGSVADRLTLTGCKSGTRVNVFTTCGKRVKTMTAGDGGATINVAGLPSGIYLLRAGDTSIKFLKK